VKRTLVAYTTEEGAHFILDDSDRSRNLITDPVFRRLMSLGPSFATTVRTPHWTTIDDQVSIFQSKAIARIADDLYHEEPSPMEPLAGKPLPHYLKVKPNPTICRQQIDQFMKEGKWRRKFPELETTIATMANKIRTHLTKVKPSHNLSKAERRCIKSLASHRDVLLIDADKSMGPVAISRNLFIEECFVHLFDDIGTYELLGLGEKTKMDTCKKLENEIEKIIESF